ncbi:Alpha/Beta hydrolase protein [Trichoderma austrokoningii]
MGTPRRFNATSFIKFGVENKQPFILVTANYRTGPWGFLPGKEVLKDGISNLGLRDQRMSMEWTSDSIAAFGGDPQKITLWGHGSGGNSVFDHLVIDGGNATYKQGTLFRGAIMSSGSFLSADQIDAKKCNGIYNNIAKAASCGKTDTLQCLREKSEADFATAASVVPGALSAESLRLLYVPRPDNDLIRDFPEVLLKNNMFVPVPMIFGTQEDEGTLFAQKKIKVRTAKRIWVHLQSQYFQKSTNAMMEGLLKKYRKKHFHGSPYGTGDDVGNWDGIKRLAAVLGDVFFLIPRRIAMFLIASSQPALPIWGYQASYDYKPIANGSFGTTHGSFEAVVFGADEYAGSFPTKTTRLYLLNFLYNLDPNSQHVELAPWPKWTVAEPLVLKFNQSSLATMRENDGERGYKYMKKQIADFRL